MLPKQQCLAGAGSPPCSPFSFFFHSRLQGHIFSDGREHDSHEFLRYVMNVLHEAHDRVAEKPPYTEVKDEPDEAPAAKAQRLWELQQAREASPVSDLFQGQLESTVVCCKCQTTFHTYEPFMDLSLSLSKEGACKGPWVLDTPWQTPSSHNACNGLCQPLFSSTGRSSEQKRFMLCSGINQECDTIFKVGPMFNKQ